MIHHETVDQMLEAWDKGETIWSLEMGGIGPGYEQALQIAAVEFSRAGKDYSPVGDNEKDAEAWRTLCGEVLSRINESLLGLSGAQYDAASWLAWQWCHKGGPRALMDRTKKKGDSERLIQVSSKFPEYVPSP